MNIFSRAQLRLTIFYGLTILVVLIATGWFGNYLQTWYVKREIDRYASPAVAAQVDAIIQNTGNDLLPFNYEVAFGIALWIALASYVMAWRSLKPLNTMFRSQQRFLANAAHELRTPLTLVRTETELALRRPKGVSREDLLAVVEHVSDESAKMADIINNLLLISSASLGKHTIPFLDITFSEAIALAIRECGPLADSRRVKLHANLALGVIVRGNRVALEQIAANVIRNAIVHTPAGGSITIDLKASQRTAHLHICDTGSGISPQDLPHILDPFYKGSITNNARHGGSGLGLAIVKELIELHEGRIRIASDVGKGTRVIISIPRTRSRAA